MKTKDNKEQEFRTELARALHEKRKAAKEVREAVAYWATNFYRSLDKMSQAAISVINEEPFLAAHVRPSAPTPPPRISAVPPIHIRVPHE